jgi:hypothetical protein
MERCPNCGAPARPGAKFCTTCGSRLPDAPAAESGAERPTVAAAGWAAPPEAEPPAAAETTATTGGESAGTAGETAGTAADQVLSTTWPADGPQSRPSTWAEEAVAQAETPAPTEPDTAETPVESAPAAADQTWEEMTAIFLPEPAAETPPIIGIMPGGAAEAQQRAIALLDELRGLLPAVVGAAPAGRPGAIADQLEAAIAAGSAEEAAELAELRAALVATRDRPRDIDTVLDLSRRVDAIVALLDAYDRSIAAINEAVRSLRTTGSEGP